MEKAEPFAVLSTRSVSDGMVVSMEDQINLAAEDSTWEDCSFIQSSFPQFDYAMQR